MKDFWGKVRNERQLLALTGLSMKQFDELLDEFSSCLDGIKKLPKKQKSESKKTRRRA